MNQSLTTVEYLFVFFLRNVYIHIYVARVVLIKSILQVIQFVN